MTTAVVTVGPEATFAEVVDTLLDNDVGGVPVVDGAGRLLGMVTEADLVAKEAYGDRPRRALGLVVDYLRGHDPQWVRKAAGSTARELMTMAPVTVAPGDDLAVAAQFMHVLPVGWVEPEDVANAVLFLASDESRYITGLPVTIDAGSMLK